MKSVHQELVIVLVPADQNAYPIWLMYLDKAGSLDWDAGNFVLCAHATAEGAERYAKGLADLTGFRVLAIR
jgi:hypothetical protein